MSKSLDGISNLGSGGSTISSSDPFLTWTGVGTAGMTDNKVLASDGTISFTYGGPKGNLTIGVDPAIKPSITAATSNIVVTPSPITGTGTVDTGNSIQLGSRLDTLGKDGILDIPVSNTSSFTGIAATGNSLINMEGNTYSGPAVAVVVAGGGAGAAKNTINNVINSLVSGITHALSGASGLVVTGYNNTVTGGVNQVVGGQQNTITNGTVVDCNGVTNSISNTIGASVTGESNNISGGVTNKIDGKLNGIVTGVQCAIRGYNNVITGGNDTWIEGYACRFDGGVTNDINILKGYNVRLINALNHRFNMWLCAAGGVSAGAHGRAATTYVGSLLIATGIPTAASAFDNSGVVAPPVGYEANNTVAIYGDRIVMDCNNSGEMRCVGVNNLRSANAPATGDDYCNKTYVDSVVPAITSFSTVVTFSGIWAGNELAFVHGQRVGNIVSLFFETINQTITTSALITAAAGSIPVGFRPTIITHLHMNVIDNALEVSGSIIVSFDGSLTIATNYANPVNGLVQAQSPFQILGTGGFPYTSLTYLIT